MARFDWKAFLDSHGITWVDDTHKNVAFGNIGVSCPLCAKEGNPDPSQHMGIHVDSGYWNCWRNRSEHSGKKPHRLIMALIGCTYDEAERIVSGRGYEQLPQQDIASSLQSMFGNSEEQAEDTDGADYVDGPMDEFRLNITETRSTARMFRRYLLNRGFTIPGLKELNKHYELWYARSGPFANRIILPVYEKGEPVTWVGRDITDRSRTRYKTLTRKPERAKHEGTPLAKQAINDCLWMPHELPKNPSVLIVTEGSLDGAKLMSTGCFSRGMIVTCLFGLAVSGRQMLLLRRLASQFRYRYLLLDTKERVASMRILEDLYVLGFEKCPVPLPDEAEDAGALSFYSAKQFVLEVINHVREESRHASESHPQEDEGREPGRDREERNLRGDQ